MSRALLVVPHFWDPICVPLGISALKAYAERAGHEVELFDFNTIPEVFSVQRAYFDELERQFPEWRRWNAERNATDLLAMHQLVYLYGRARPDYRELVAEVLNVTAAPLETVASRLKTAPFDTLFAKLYARVGSIFQGLVASARPDVIGCSLFNSTWPATLFLLRRAKALAKGARTVVGGPGPIMGIASSVAEVSAFHSAHDFIDYYVLGEGEKHFVSILEQPELPRGILGGEVARFRAGGTRPDMQLSELPDPDYGHLEVSRYLQLSAASSRGCPFECSFCAETVFWKGYRKLPTDRLADQMVALSRRHGKDSFYLCDSLSNPILDGLSQALLERDAKLHFDCYVRADRTCVDAAKTARWRDAGLFRARLGLESASQRILDEMVKKTDPGTMSRALQALSESGVRTSTLWIAGYPGETLSEFDDTLKFLRENRANIYDADAWLFQYHPRGLAGSSTKLKGSGDAKARFGPELSRLARVDAVMVDDGLSPGDRLERLERFVATMQELEIPNPYSLTQWRSADARWEALGHAPRWSVLGGGMEATR
ncbi:B12-binding domain-containing radical SAM protein [Myxococcus sp. K38C18041901]|uniref:B12-binding domain-containing radical SAM protein n=1 Tax=Myxococcus guangdongensis TaxID=2906760 RepID=UPI0020A81841|nr:radical SAM protein [Myxococcus guangdongensis]MCP3059803.1 B12-binding domain-containing radical SAM protein [Myxococcus guangdongensis]